MWESIWRYFPWFLSQIKISFVFLARNTVEQHYFCWYISRITILTPGIFDIFQIFSNLAEGFRSKWSFSIAFAVCTYLDIFFSNKSHRWRVIQEIRHNFAKNAIVWIEMEFIPVISRPNDRNIRGSRTKYSGTALALLKDLKNYDYHAGDRKISIFSKYFQI